MQSNRLCEGVWGMVEPVILPATPDIWHLIHQQWPSHKIHHHPKRFGSYMRRNEINSAAFSRPGGGGAGGVAARFFLLQLQYKSE